MSLLRSYQKSEGSQSDEKMVCGYLSKQGQLLSKRRWCVLHDKALYIFKSHQDKQPSECIEVTSCSFKSLEESTSRFIFSLRPLFDPGKSFIFQADFQDSFQSWCEALSTRAKPLDPKRSGLDEGNFWSFRSGSQTFTFLTPDSSDGFSKNRWDISCLLESKQKQGFLVAAGSGIVKHWRPRWITIQGRYLLQFKNEKADFISIAVPLELVTKDDVGIVAEVDAGQFQLPPILPSVSGESSTSTVVVQSQKVFWFYIHSDILNKTFYFGALSTSERLEWISKIRELVSRQPVNMQTDFDIASVQTVESKLDPPNSTPLRESSSSNGSQGNPQGQGFKGGALAKYKMKPMQRYPSVSTISSVETGTEDWVNSPKDITGFEALQTIKEMQDGESVQDGENRRSVNISMSEIEVRRKIGRGASGKVYFGYYKGRQVAVKKLFIRKLTPKDLQNFQLEVELTSKLRHPNIIELIGSSREAPNLLVIMEYASKGTLSNLLYDLGFDFPWQLRMKMMIQAARAMDFVHSSDILHRDLKSANMLICEDYTLKISDFGVARYFAGDVLSMTQIGSPCWMAPEVIRNEPYGQPADIYSFAVVMWEMHYRRVPYDGMNGMQVSYKVVMEKLRPPVPPPDLQGQASTGDSAMVEDDGAPVELPDATQIESSMDDLTERPSLSNRQSFGGRSLSPRKVFHPLALVDGPEGFLELMKRGWSELPSERPSFANIIPQLEEMASNLPSAS